MMGSALFLFSALFEIRIKLRACSFDLLLAAAFFEGLHRGAIRVIRGYHARQFKLQNDLIGNYERVGFESIDFGRRGIDCSAEQE